jgi:hypothetical protein
MAVETGSEKQLAIEAAASIEHQAPKKRKTTHWAAAIVVSLAVAGALTSGILPRVTARTTLRKETAQMAVPTVAVIRPERTAQAEEIVLPANVQAFISAPQFMPEPAAI